MRYAMLPLFAILASACSGDRPPEPPSRSNGETVGKAAQSLATPADPPGAPPHSNATVYQEIRGSGIDSNAVSLCQLLKFYTAAAGAYRVKSLTGYTEELLDLPGHFDGFTYVELELVADWSGASPANPVVRITGGPATADITGSWTVSLKVGEIVGLLLEAPSAANRGFLGMHPLTVFRQNAAGGYTNGQLFTKQVAALDTIGHAVQGLVSLGNACDQQDVLPDIDGFGPVPVATAPLVAHVTVLPLPAPADGGAR